jgi:hypothetical protein
MVIRTIIFNSTHCNNTASNKNSYTYAFRGGGLELDPTKKHSIAVSNITIPYSFFNISDIYNNRNFSLIINGTTYNINLPASFMDVSDLNKYLQWWFIQNNFYCLDAFGNYVYFLEFEYNVSRYAVECIFYPMTLPSGGSNPGGMTFSGNTMQLVISAANSNFGKLLGLSPGTYPSTVQTVTTSQLSNITVEGSPINALSLCCTLVNNDISNTPDSFYSFTPSGSFGSNLVLQPPELLWCSANSGRFQQITITIKDQENRDIQMRDSTICISLALKTED